MRRRLALGVLIDMAMRPTKRVYKLLQRFKNRPLGILASELKAFLRSAPEEMARIERKFVSWRPESEPIGDVLLCYENRGFLLKPGEPVPIDHTNRWESVQIALTFLDLGYRVDVINENNDRFVPTKNYSFFVGNRINFARLAELLNEDCVKILHVDTAHWLFNNTAECRRLQRLQERRGFVLLPRRYLAPNFAIEHAGYATVLGNDFTMSTYRYANKPLYRVPVSSPRSYGWQEDKDFDRVRKHFLWFGSNGFVHKGLDVVLEAFAQMPDYRLTVCGPLRIEPDFEKSYQKELYETPNIHTAGWVDTEGPEFLSLVKDCIGIVFPSCSEGGGAGVITCLHAGLIPLVTREASVDVDSRRGLIIEECSVDAIKAAAQRLALLTPDELRTIALRNVEFARAQHSRERFAKRYAEIVSEIIAAETRKNERVLETVAERTVPAGLYRSDPKPCAH